MTAGAGPRYDVIGVGYTANRRPDPRIAAQIEAAVGGARSQVNVGAGTGSYEQPHRRTVAVEPSAVMLAQRPPGAAPAVQGAAEHLPFADAAFDVATAFMTVHHWADLGRGLAELRRVSRRQVVFCFEPAGHDALWVVTDYFPSIRGVDPAGSWAGAVAAALAPSRTETVMVPADCTDGFASAYWRRPARYLDQSARDNISVFAHVPADELADGLARLRHDLDTGAWARRYRHLLDVDTLDTGLRLVVAGSDP